MKWQYIHSRKEAQRRKRINTRAHWISAYFVIGLRLNSNHAFLDRAFALDNRIVVRE
jgi:hypothetical protein